MRPKSFTLILAVCLVSLLQKVSASGNGVIGFGLSLYQDVCCQACYDSLSALYLSCTTFSNDTSMNISTSDMAMMMGETNAECYASNGPWLQTMAYCIQANCDAHGFPTDKQAACFSTHAVAGASSPNFQESLPSVPPTVELEADAMWLNVTSLVNSYTYSSTYGTEAEFARSEYIHTRYSLILYFMTVGIIFGGGILAQFRARSPGFRKFLSTSQFWAKLQQYLILPALFGSRHLEPLLGRAGYLPSRTVSIFITIYIIVNIVLCSVSYRSFQPNVFWASTPIELCEYVGNRTGILGLVNVSIAILFAGRNNLLILLTGWSQTTFLTLHRWSARVATLQTVVHSIVYTLQYFEPPTGGARAYAAKVKETFYWVGIIATIAMCLMVAHSILPLRLGSYESFLAIHVALAIITLVTCWYHLVPHFGYVYGYQVWLYICFVFWFFDRFARVARIIYYNRFGTSVAIVEAVPGCDVLQVTVFPRVWKFGPGQHSFLYVPDSSLYIPGLGAKFWENHPFSVAGWEREGDSSVVCSPPASVSDSTVKGDDTSTTNVISISQDVEQSIPAAAQQPSKASDQQKIHEYSSIQFLMRVHKGMTASLQRRVLSSPSHSVEIAMYTEGPYAGHKTTLSPFMNADTILLLIGGIGITTALSYVQEYADSHLRKGEITGRKNTIMNKATRLTLVWSAKEIALIEHIRTNFLSKHDGAAGIEYSFWYTGIDESETQNPARVGVESHELRKLSARTMAGVTNGKMNIRTVLRSYVEPALQTTVLACGPGSLIDEARREVVSCVKDGLKVDIVEEAFGW